MKTKNLPKGWEKYQAQKPPKTCKPIGNKIDGWVWY